MKTHLYLDECRDDTQTANDHTPPEVSLRAVPGPAPRRRVSSETTVYGPKRPKTSRCPPGRSGSKSLGLGRPLQFVVKVLLKGADGTGLTGLDRTRMDLKGGSGASRVGRGVGVGVRVSASGVEIVGTPTLAHRRLPLFLGRRKTYVLLAVGSRSFVETRGTRKSFSDHTSPTGRLRGRRHFPPSFL